ASADYIADGTSDQTEINAALTAGAGGKVYLAEGTYVVNATILVPNNTTLEGAGKGTVIELADIDATDNLMENSDTSTGAGITIRNLTLDGRSDLNTSGDQNGIVLKAATDSNIENITGQNFSLAAVGIDSYTNSVKITNVTITNSERGVDIGGAWG